MKKRHKMKRVLLIAALAFASPAQAQPKPDGIDSFLTHKMAQYHIPALQVAVVRHGKIVKLAAYGIANIENAVPVSDCTVFSINSATKAFSAVAVMQLVEAGKLKLDDPISRYLDAIPAAWRSITIRQVLAHTSGLPDIINAKENMLGDGDAASAWAMVKTLPLVSKPGDQYNYIQTGYAILGMIVDKLAGEPFVQFIEDRQFKPAGMTSTRYGDGADIILHSASAYSFLKNVDGKWTRGDSLSTAYATFPPFLRMGSGILSTAPDIARWLIALQSGKLLKDKGSLDALWTPIFLNDGKTGGPNDLLNGSGLGWPVIVRAEHPAAVAIGGMRSAIAVYPKDDLAVVILTNLLGANPERLVDLVLPRRQWDYSPAITNLPLDSVHFNIADPNLSGPAEILAPQQHPDTGQQLLERKRLDEIIIPAEV